MLLFLLLVTSIIIVLVVPFLAIRRYYHLNFYTTQGQFLFVVTLLTWPLVPVTVALRNKDIKLFLLFMVSLIIWFVAGGVWLADNFAYFIEIHNNYINNLGTSV